MRRSSRDPHHLPAALPTALAATLALGALLALTPGQAQATEVYLKAGAPGVGGGIALPMSPHLGLRADYLKLGERRERRTEDGIDYDATAKAARGALLADWFPFGGSFRFTLGATSNQYKIDLLASGAGGSLTLGSSTYNTTAADQFRVQVKFPSSTPYVGLGWGHGMGSGLRFSFDIGASVGKATVSYQLSGPIATQASQADIDAELAELRDGVGRIKAIPQLTFGLGWSF